MRGVGSGGDGGSDGRPNLESELILVLGSQSSMSKLSLATCLFSVERQAEWRSEWERKREREREREEGKHSLHSRRVELFQIAKKTFNNNRKWRPTGSIRQKCILSASSRKSVQASPGARFRKRPLRIQKPKYINWNEKKMKKIINDLCVMCVCVFG